jgi:hypothetical protein
VSERELWTTTQVGEFFGLNSPATARSRINRLGLTPATGPEGARLVDPESGENLYDAAEVRAGKERMPGKGVGGGRPRKDQPAE